MSGFYFAGWSTSVDGSDGILLKKGDVIRIDTLDEDSNVLYAQWKAETPAPMGITDEPLPFAVMSLAGIGRGRTSSETGTAEKIKIGEKYESTS